MSELAPWKYQRAVVAAIVNYNMAMIHATIQKKPNMKIQNMAKTSYFSSRTANICPCLYTGSPVLYKYTLTAAYHATIGKQTR